MKQLLILLTASFFMLSSCKKLLETRPGDFVSGRDYYATATELNAALSGVYSALAQDGTYARNLVMELAQGTDEGFYKRNDIVVTPYVYNHDASSPIINACWRQLYDGINRANLLLTNINKPTMDEQERNRIKGEALFLRAFMYYLLVDKWGDVPLLLTPVVSSDDVDRPRVPAAEILEQITKDMKEAYPLVQKISDIGFSGRVSQTTIAGILARVYLKWAGYPLMDIDKYADAREWALNVINSGEHQLATDYKQIFINHSSDQYDIKESMWEIEFFGNNNTANKTGSRFANHFAIRCLNDSLGYGYAMVGATGYLYKLYTDTSDVRRDWTIAPYSFKGNNTAEKVPKASTDIYTRDIGKWRREYETVLPYGRDWSQTNFPVLRYADVLLMFAEAENEVNGPTSLAHQYLNAIRERAGAHTFTGDSTIADKETFRKTIMDERARELAFEALRKSDLIRWGVFLSVMQHVGADIAASGSPVAYGAKGYNNVSQRHLLQPIPVNERSLNHLITQNPGW